ncbi:MAG: hypothetical protein ACREFC_02160 [Stellaceae bacterium]
MARTDDAPQTVGDALRHEWHFLGVECAHCRKGRTRVDLRKRRPDERLADVATLCWCRRCGPSTGRSYLMFELISVVTSESRKPIAFSGRVALKLGMN